VSIVLVVDSSQKEGIFEHWHRVILSSLFFELLIGDDGLSIVFELINPRLFLEAADAITEGFLLSPQDIMRQKIWVGDIDGLSQMVLLNVVSWALDVGWQVPVVLHPSFIQEWFSHFKSMSGSSSIDSKNIEFIKLFHESVCFKSTFQRRWLFLEVKISLGDFVRSLTGVDDDIIGVLSDVLTQQVHWC